MQDCPDSGGDEFARRQMPCGLNAIGVFLFFGATMATFASATLTLPGTSLDRIWVFNPAAYKRLVSFCKPVGLLFLLLATVLAVAGTGWFKHRLWGWRLAVAVIAIQVLGDLVNFSRGDFLRGGVGFTIASVLLLYLLRPSVRTVFTGAKPS